MKNNSYAIYFSVNQDKPKTQATISVISKILKCNVSHSLQ